MTDLDDDIIELTDIATKDSDLSTDEDVIELTDIAEDVIELTDIAEDETTNLDFDIIKEDEFNPEINDSEDAEQIDDEFTDDVYEDDEAEDDLDDDELTGIDQIDDELEDDAADIITDKPEVELDSKKVVPEDFNIDQEQIETILERIIEKKFAGKIESILFEVMENVIEKQIVEIKESLQKDLE